MLLFALRFSKVSKLSIFQMLREQDKAQGLHHEQTRDLEGKNSGIGKCMAAYLGLE